MRRWKEDHCWKKILRAIKATACKLSGSSLNKRSQPDNFTALLMICGRFLSKDTNSSLSSCNLPVTKAFRVSPLFTLSWTYAKKCRRGDLKQRHMLSRNQNKGCCIESNVPWNHLDSLMRYARLSSYESGSRIASRSSLPVSCARNHIQQHVKHDTPTMLTLQV